VPLSRATRFDELKATSQLPSPTGVALAILRLAESERTTVQEIAHVLQSDPALSGRILKLANSASAGLLKAAEEATYAAKQGRPNRVCLAPGADPQETGPQPARAASERASLAAASG
jgi:hypothetical protein